MRAFTFSLIAFFFFLSGCRLFYEPVPQEEVPVSTYQTTKSHPLNGQWNWINKIEYLGSGGQVTSTPASEGYTEILSVCISNSDSLYKIKRNEIIIDSGKICLFKAKPLNQQDSVEAIDFLPDSTLTYWQDRDSLNFYYTNIVDERRKYSVWVYNINGDTLIIRSENIRDVVDGGGFTSVYSK